MLIVKYAIIGALSVVAGVYLAGLFGQTVMMSYPVAAVSGAVGGAIGGWLRQRKGKIS